MCYKTHKAEHTQQPLPQIEPSKELQAQSVQDAEPKAAEPKATEQGFTVAKSKSKRPNFEGLESDPDLLRLLQKYSSLRIQLQSVYGLTLEPHPDEMRQQGGFRGGRGGFRGRGRGRGSFMNQQGSHGKWSQAKGDKEAESLLKSQREGDNSEGVEEFVQLIKMKYGSAEDQET